MTPLPASVTDTLAMLGSADYVADRSLATAVHLALHLNRPLFLEGEAGVGKTEIAKVLASALKRRLIRLQCYEGLDVASAVYEWDYARQMIEIRLAEAAEEDRSEIESTIFSERFLIKRPLLQALEPEIAGAPVLLIDELDRTDEPFEAYLLEKGWITARQNQDLIASVDRELEAEREFAMNSPMPQPESAAGGLYCSDGCHDIRPKYAVPKVTDAKRSRFTETSGAVHLK